MELVQRCNVHLSYLGRGIFVDHVLRLDTSFEIFGISNPIDMPSTSKVIGELSVEESEALKALLSLGTCVISDMGGPVINPTTTSMSTLEQPEPPAEILTQNVETPIPIPTLAREPKKYGTLLEEDVLDILNNQPKVILQ